MHQKDSEGKHDTIVLLGEAYHATEDTHQGLKSIISPKQVHIQQSIVTSPLKRGKDESAYVYCQVETATHEFDHDTNISDSKADDCVDISLLNSNGTTSSVNNNSIPKKTFNDFMSFFSNISHSGEKHDNVDYPQEFKDDLETRLYFTYRYGFTLIERDKNGPAPLSLGSLFRGTLDFSTIHKGFTTDSGWGCMIRTSQSLVANSLLNLCLGRDWRLKYATVDELEEHWKIVALFADTPTAVFSLHNYVAYANKHCGTKVGEWFGPSNAARSIQAICSDYPTESCLKVYVTNDSGDIFEDELQKLSTTNEIFQPTLILCGIRLGVKNINIIYWDFLKYIMSISQSVGIAGGRPSSSHYFLGVLGDYLLYLDPHIAQTAIQLDTNGIIQDEEKRKIFGTIHTSALQKIHMGKIDPSMLVGFLIRSKEDFMDFKQKMNSFANGNKFINIYPQKPELFNINSAGSDLDGFVDLGVESINESYRELENNEDDINISHLDDTDIVDVANSSLPPPPSSEDIVDGQKPILSEEPLEVVRDEMFEKESLIVVSSGNAV